MTVDQNAPQQGGQVAIPSGSTGLEDFDTADAIIPRLSIQHRFGTFKDNLSGAEFQELRMVILGLVKQRILWYHVVDDGKNEQPMCKSPNFSTGYPDQDPPRGKEFPWEKSGFNPADFPQDEQGNQPLPCANCQLKEWGSHPNGNTPYCAEQWTLAVMYDPNGDGNWLPAFLTLQKSGLKSIRSYLTSFARSNRPAYTEVCKVTLTQKTRGQVEYCTPNFIGDGASDSNAWLEYSENYDQMRSYLTAAPIPSEDDTPTTQGSDNTWNQGQQQQQQAPQQEQQPQQSVQQPQATQPQPSQQQPTPATPGSESSASSATPSEPQQPQQPTTPPPPPAQPAQTQPPAQAPNPQGQQAQPPSQAPQGGTPGGSDLPF